MKTVAIVTKNADFTEGRGPMVFHKVFETEEKAVEYIMRQNGIYGSKQFESNEYSFYPNERVFNGYKLIVTPVE